MAGDNMKASLLVAAIALLTLGCGRGTTASDRLPEVENIELYVRYEGTDTPAEGLKVEITRFFVGAIPFSSGSMIPIYVGRTDRRGELTYRTQLNGMYEIWVRGKGNECWDGGYHRIQNFDRSRIVEVVLRPC